MSLKDDIRAIGLRRQEVEVPEWNCLVSLRELTGLERLRLDAGQAALKDRPEAERNFVFGVRLIIAAAEDADGQPLFSPEDESWLTQASPDALVRLVGVAAGLSQMTEQDQEDLRKNWPPARSNGSPSDSASKPAASTLSVP